MPISSKYDSKLALRAPTAVLKLLIYVVTPAWVLIDNTLFHEAIMLSRAELTSSKITASFALIFPSIFVEFEVGPRYKDLKSELTGLNVDPSAENAPL